MQFLKNLFKKNRDKPQETSFDYGEQVFIKIHGKDFLSKDSLEVIKKGLNELELNLEKNFRSKNQKEFVSEDKKFRFKIIKKDPLYLNKDEKDLNSRQREHKKLEEKRLKRGIYNDNLICYIHKSKFEKSDFSDKILNLFRFLSENLLINFGGGTMGLPQKDKKNYILPLKEMSYTPNSLGWFIILGQHHKDIIKINEDIESFFYKTFRTKNNIILTKSRSPQEEISENKKQQIQEALYNSYYKNKS
jgi:hypothetical protein